MQYARDKGRLVETSHISVRYTSGATSPAPALGAATAPGTTTPADASQSQSPLGAFEAILSRLIAGSNDNSSASARPLTGLVSRKDEAPTLATPQQPAPAAAPSGVAPASPTTLLGDFVGELMALGAAGAKNTSDTDATTSDPADLKKLRHTVNVLAGILGVQQIALPGAPAAAATPLADATPATTSSTEKTIAPTTQLMSLAAQIEKLSATLGKGEPALATQLNAIAQKLGATPLSPATLTSLGLTADGTPADKSLNDAINALISKAAAPTPASPTTTPQLAAASLHLPAVSAFSAPGAAASATAHPATATTDTTDTTDKSSSAAATPAPGAQKGPTTTAAAIKIVAASSAAGDQRKDADSGSNPDSKPSPQTAALQAPSAATAPVAASAKAMAAAYQTAPIVNLPQMAFQIAHHMQNGDTSFDIKLDPAGLGGVNVRLDIASSGAVNAHLTVDRPDTLALLQRDATSLGLALTQAGLDGSKTNLQFSLNQNAFSNPQQQRQANGGTTAPPVNAASAPEPASAPILTTRYYGTLAASGLNIFV